MGNLFVNLLKGTPKFLKDAFTKFLSSTASVFKSFVILVLLQFGFISFMSVAVPDLVVDIPALEAVISSSHYWWGWGCLLGAGSLFFESYIGSSILFLFLGYGAAISSFLFLSYDYSFRHPPIYTGGILAVTAAACLGGLLYGKFKSRRVQ